MSSVAGGRAGQSGMPIPSGCKTPRVWLTALVVHAAIVQLAVTAARPTISYRALEIGLPAAWLGPLSASFALLPMLLAIPLGGWIDRHRVVPVLWAGTLGLVVTLLGLTWAAGVMGLVALTMSLGLAQLGVVVAAQGLIARASHGLQHDRRFGTFGFAVSGGQLLGPLLLLLMDDETHSGSGLVFGVSAGASALGAVVLLAVRTPLPQEDLSGPRRRGGVGTVLTTPGVPVTMLSSLTVIATVDMLTAYLPAVGQQLGISAGVVGVLLSLRSAASMISRAGLAWIVQVAGRRRAQSLNLALSSVGVLGVAIAPNSVVLGASLVLAGAGLGIIQPLTMAFVAGSVPSAFQATGLSVRLVGNRLGQLTLPSVGGLAVAGVGLSGVFLGTAVVLALAAVVSHVFMPDASGRRPSGPTARGGGCP